MSSAQASSERKSSSFANPTKSNRVNKRIKPLTRDFFTQLIKLEADFHNKVYTVSTLDELIQFYAKAVEYYDSIKDEISAYFIFKIQDILATKKSLKMLLDQNAKGITKRGVPSGSADHENDANPEKASQKKVTFGDAEPKQDNILEESSEEDEDDEEKHLSEFDKKRTAKRKERAKDRLSISRMKNEKQRFVNFFYKMETQKVSEKQNMKVVMNEFGSMSQKNDSYVKKDIDYQKDRLRKRIDKKKGENYMSHTMNLQSFQLGNSADDHQDRKDDIIYENFLEGLGSHREEFSKDDSDRTDNGSLTDNQMFNENTHTRSNFGPRSMNEGSHTHSPSNQTGSNQSLSAGAIQEAHMTSES